jgi:hypothetical protein
VNVVKWNESYGREVATWPYEPTYDFYDLTSDPDDEAATHDPARTAYHRDSVSVRRIARHASSS